MSRSYVVMIEGEAPSLSAWVPELPGCVAAGETREEVVGLIRGAIALHTEDEDDAEALGAPSDVALVTI
jgi:predicted RNase H-like HicB family nuclease